MLLLDADNHAIHDPTLLFSSPQFAATGLLVWPDLWFYEKGELRKFWEVIGRPDMINTAITAHESGQIVIDKRRMWAVLMLVCFVFGSA